MLGTNWKEDTNHTGFPRCACAIHSFVPGIQSNRPEVPNKVRTKIISIFVLIVRLVLSKIYLELLDILNPGRFTFHLVWFAKRLGHSSSMQRLLAELESQTKVTGRTYAFCHKGRTGRCRGVRNSQRTWTMIIKTVVWCSTSLLQPGKLRLLSVSHLQHLPLFQALPAKENWGDGLLER